MGLRGIAFGRIARTHYTVQAARRVSPTAGSVHSIVHSTSLVVARTDMGLAVYPRIEYSRPMKSNIGNTVIETESFIKQAAALWSTAELDDL
jgi:hypothetical protein